MLTRGRMWGASIGAPLGGLVLAAALSLGECFLDIAALCPIPQHLRAASVGAAVVAGGLLGFLYACVIEQLLAPGRPPSRLTATGLVLGLTGGVGWPAAVMMTAGALLGDAHSDPSRGYAQIAIGCAIASVALFTAFLAGAAMLLANDPARQDR